MTLENLATARDWAVIILAAQAIVVAAVVVFVAWQTYRAMRRVRPKVVHGLHDARHAAQHDHPRRFAQRGRRAEQRGRHGGHDRQHRRELPAGLGAGHQPRWERFDHVRAGGRDGVGDGGGQRPGNTRDLDPRDEHDHHAGGGHSRSTGRTDSSGGEWNGAGNERAVRIAVEL